MRARSPVLAVPLVCYLAVTVGIPLLNGSAGRAGFVDMAHLRLWADFTIFLAAWVGAHLESGGTLAIRDEAGQRRIVLAPRSMVKATWW